MFIKYEQILIN